MSQQCDKCGRKMKGGGLIIPQDGVMVKTGRWCKHKKCRTNEVEAMALGDKMLDEIDPNGKFENVREIFWVVFLQENRPRFDYKDE